MTAQGEAKGKPRKGELKAMQSPAFERFVLLLGAALLGAVVAEVVLLMVAAPEQGKALWQMVLVEFFAGREAGIPIALGADVPRWLVAQVSATQDIGVVCLAYPLFLRLMHRFRASERWLMVRLRRIQADAEAHRGLVHRWGGIGIFLFMLVPFLVNGPLVGAVAGRLTGMKTTDLAVPVIAATVVAAVAWTYFYDGILWLTGDIAWLPWVLTGVILALVLGSLIVRETLEIRRGEGRKATVEDHESD